MATVIIVVKFSFFFFVISNSVVPAARAVESEPRLLLVRESFESLFSPSFIIKIVIKNSELISESCGELEISAEIGPRLAHFVKSDVFVSGTKE